MYTLNAFFTFCHAVKFLIELVMLWSGDVFRPSLAILCRRDFSRSIFSSFDNRKYLIKKQLF